MNKIYQSDKEMIGSSNELQELTNKFLSDFLEIAKKTQKNYSTDSFELNYSLPECLINSPMLKNNPEAPMHPLLDMGFCQNIVLGLFERNVFVMNFGETLNCIINNFDNQEPYSDYRAEGKEVFTEEIIAEDINIDRLLKKDNTLPLIIKVPKNKKSIIFVLSNNKNGFKGKCEVVYINEKLKEVFVYNTTNEKILTLVVRVDGKTFEPTISHFKHVADINSFFHVMEQIEYGIEETLNEEKK